MIITKTYEEPDFNIKEILRYAGCRDAESDIITLVNECIDEARGVLSYKVCHLELPVCINGDVCDFGAFNMKSASLAKNLADCGSAIVFAATVGVGIDRLIARYSRISPSKALIMQAIGSERVEALCDVFCDDISQTRSICLKPRFSPGYGDVCLDVQKSFFDILDCSKRIGVSLNDSLLMSPSKSVTAFVGICLADGNRGVL